METSKLSNMDLKNTSYKDIKKTCENFNNKNNKH